MQCGFTEVKKIAPRLSVPALGQFLSFCSPIVYCSPPVWAAFDHGRRRRPWAVGNLARGAERTEEVEVIIVNVRDERERRLEDRIRSAQEAVVRRLN